jgi:iron(III) transport system ATP-binding protein
MSFLALKNISKYFGTTRVLNDVTLSIAQGEFVCFLGPSGSGKSTLLNCIMGLMEPSEGTCHVSGQDITVVPPEKRGFGVVFQEYTLFPNLTVFENVKYGLHKSQWSVRESTHRVDELLSLVGLEGYARSYPADLSGGQQQRVALARALAPRPQLLLLDEPLSALDARVRAQLRQELKKIQRETNITTIMVTHDQEEAFELADTIFVINDGLIEQAGAPIDLHTQPASAFVAQFIGTMNVVSLGWIRNGLPTGVRYEDVMLNSATEQALQVPYSCTGRVESILFRGAFSRVQLLLSDYKTRVFSDIPTSDVFFTPNDILAVTVPEQHWCIWD